MWRFAANLKSGGIKIMMPLTIHCNHSILQFNPDVQFFILCKGQNAGKPGTEPWSNSFVATACNQEMRDFYYWLTYGLFRTKAFESFHRGSVIPFIYLQETRDLIMPAAFEIYPKWDEFKLLLRQMELLETRKNNLAEILKNTATLQEYLIRNYFIQQGIKT